MRHTTKKIASRPQERKRDALFVEPRTRSSAVHFAPQRQIHGDANGGRVYRRRVLSALARFGPRIFALAPRSITQKGRLSALQCRDRDSDADGTFTSYIVARCDMDASEAPKRDASLSSPVVVVSTCAELLKRLVKRLFRAYVDHGFWVRVSSFESFRVIRFEK